MDKDVIQVLLSALGIIASLVAAVRYLMKVNFKQAKEMEKIKETHTSKAIAALEIALNKYVARLDAFDNRLGRIENEYRSSVSRFEELHRDYTGMMNLVREYTRKTEQRLASQDSKLVEFGKVIHITKGGVPK